MGERYAKKEKAIPGLRSLRFWRKWSNLPQERVAIQGALAEMWGTGKQNRLLVKVQPVTGASKLLLVGADFIGLLPDNEKENVCIEYLTGTEASISIETLAPAGEESETKDMA